MIVLLLMALGLIFAPFIIGWFMGEISLFYPFECYERRHNNVVNWRKTHLNNEQHRIDHAFDEYKNRHIERMDDDNPLKAQWYNNAVGVYKDAILTKEALKRLYAQDIIEY